MKSTNPIEICFIDFFVYPLFNSQSKIVFGGAQIQLYLLAKELAKDKKFSIAFLTDNRQDNRLETFGKIKVYQFLRSPHQVAGIAGTILFLLNKLPLFNHLEFIIRLFILLKKIDADIYLQRAASAETGLIAIVAKLLGKKFIFMVAHQQDVNGDFIKKNGLKGRLYLLGLKLADQIICQTKEQQAQLRKGLKRKSSVISSGYPIEKPGKLTQLKKQGVLWVARAESWKNPELFINLAKKIPQEKFTMICPPAENNPTYFRTILVNARKIPNIKFIERVPFKSIDAYFAKAKVLVATADSEGFPNTFIQAAKNKTPIISFKVNPDKIIDKYQIGSCAEGNERQMIILLKELLKSNQLWQRLATNAYNYARQCHDIKNTVRQYQKLFEREYS